MKKDKKKSPFFAKFLEKQVKKQEKVKGMGRDPITMKWPSDNDEDSPKGKR